MNINKINTNISFQGYKNLVSYSHKGFMDTEHAYMAMRLNNDGPCKDLDTWHAIQKTLFKGEPLTDFFLFTSSVLHKLNIITVNNYNLDLKQINSREEEKAILKAFTLISSLTKRISSIDNHPQDREYNLTLQEALKMFKKVFTRDDHVAFLIMNGASKVVKHYETADLINNNISKKMARYFKL